MCPAPLESYSVLTHEQIIDLAWNSTLQPFLLKRFPRLTPEELHTAHAYAYGGCAIQDLGYYPFANDFFSDLTHYVRTGVFLRNLLQDARDANELAFALGAVSHYVGDNIGHHDAVNVATALSFPKLNKKYGSVVTYDEDPHAHVRVEFAFDIEQLSRHRLAPGAYLRFIGLRVPVRLLTQAFQETYALHLTALLGPGRQAVRSYRASVRSFLPRIAHAESVLHRKQFLPETPSAILEQYLNDLNQAAFQTVWNGYRQQPRIPTYLTAFLIRILPKVGVLSELAIKIPTQETQDLYMRSVTRTVDEYCALLQRISDHPAVARSIPDRDLDTGEPTKPGSYALTDATYAKLLAKLAATPRQSVEAGLKADILAFYKDPNAAGFSRKNRRTWAGIEKDLAVLQGMPTVPDHSPVDQS